MFKRIIAFILTALCLVAAPNAVHAAGELPEAIAAKIEYGAVYDLLTGQVLFESRIDEKRDMAGLARLPMLLAICEAFDSKRMSEDMVVNVSDAAARVKGPTAFIEGGESIAAGELLKAAVMILAGDAVFALAEACFGTSEGAGESVSARLAELGISDCTIENAACENVRLSIRDLLHIADALIASPTYMRLCSVYMDEITHENGSRTELVNQNRLLRSSSGCIGLATGSSASAGYCGLFALRRQDTTLVCAVAGCGDSKTRFSLASDIMEWGFASFKSHIFARAGECVAQNVPVSGGKAESVSLIAAETVSVLAEQNEKYEKVENIPEMLNAPVEMGAVLGSVEYYNESSELVARVELVAETAIERSELFDSVLMVMKRWILG